MTLMSVASNMAGFTRLQGERKGIDDVSLSRDHRTLRHLVHVELFRAEDVDLNTVGNEIVAQETSMAPPVQSFRAHVGCGRS